VVSPMCFMLRIESVILELVYVVDSCTVGEESPQVEEFEA
jgi:hypothetical protein